MIYFDAAATTFQKPPQVALAVQETMTGCASPGRGGYALAEQADAVLFSCRQRAARYFDAEPEQVVFTMNATHGLNLAIHTLVKPGSRVVVSGMEHNAVMRPLHHRQAEISVVDTPLFDDIAFLNRLERLLQRPCSAVILNHVSNVFGWRLPVEQAAALCRARRVPLVIDASQSAGILPVSLRRTGAAFVAMPGHKGLYGPQGTGLLLCAAPAEPLLQGGTGSQSRLASMPPDLPERLEPGTANVPGIAGLAAGLAFVGAQPGLLEQERRLCRQTCRLLRRYPGVRVFQGPASGQVGVVSMTGPLDCEELAAQLARREICVRAGLHCAPLAHQTAGTLERGTVRFSFSAFNTLRELDALENALDAIFSQTRRGR